MRDRFYSPARFGILAITLGFFGCSTGASRLVAPLATASPVARGASVALTISWPARAAASAKRHRSYVSASTKSLTVSVGGARVLEADNPSNGAAVTQTYDIVVAPGLQQTFLVALYDAAGGTGNLLGRSTTLQDVVADQANQLTIVVDGELSKSASCRSRIRISRRALPARPTRSSARSRRRSR